MLLHEDEHTVIPKLVYITHPTENGGVYTKAELKALRECCDKHGLYLYMDGARLGTALTWPGNDVTLKDLPELTDAFYIGGTKIGTLFGEALVILNDDINDHFRYMVKLFLCSPGQRKAHRHTAQSSARGRRGLTVLSAFRHENQLAIKLAKGVQEKRLQTLDTSSDQSGILSSLTTTRSPSWKRTFFFYTWAPYDETSSVIRLVISWGSTEEDVDAILAALVAHDAAILLQ